MFNATINLSYGNLKKSYLIGINFCEWCFDCFLRIFISKGNAGIYFCEEFHIFKENE